MIRRLCLQVMAFGSALWLHGCQAPSEAEMATTSDAGASQADALEIANGVDSSDRSEAQASAVPPERRAVTSAPVDAGAVPSHIDVMTKINTHPKISPALQALAASSDDKFTIIVEVDYVKIDRPKAMRPDPMMSQSERLERLEKSNVESAENKAYSEKVQEATKISHARVSEIAVKIQALTGEKPRIFSTAYSVVSQVTAQELSEIADWDHIKNIQNNTRWEK